MLPRTLEPEVMDTADEARDYDAMDHAAVNRLFVDDLLKVLAEGDLRESPDKPLSVLDVGTGTAQIPIELCRREPRLKVTGIDLAARMLELGRQNVKRTGLDGRVTLELVDAKGLPYEDGAFDVVMSNSIVHHIPEPLEALAEMWRVVRPGGVLFVRDLMRPDDLPTLERLVAEHAADANSHQRQMFSASLHAALRVNEVQERLKAAGVHHAEVGPTSDRHWTVIARRP